MPGDKKTIGITASNATALADLTAMGSFGSELDAAKFAMAYAIRIAAAPGSADGAETKWNVGSVDPDGSLRSLIEALFPEADEPYRLAEQLMNSGLQELARAKASGSDLYDVLFPAR
jgi:hypothetical protein